MSKRDLLLDGLRKTRYGELNLVLPDGSARRYAGSEPGESATMIVKDWKTADAIVSRGDIGLGESYMAHHWDSPDLKAFLTFCQRNRDEFARLTKFDFVNKLIARAVALASKNTLTGSKKNISAHYDLPPELFQAFTDRSLTYSCGFYDGKEISLEQAQINKYERILNRIGPPPAHILEMGCGWGSFLELAAARGYTITGCTISKQQYEFAKERNKEAIADGRVTVLLEDYRNVPGEYDAVVSVGFFEHVGSQFWVEHFRKVSQYLRRGGVAMIQTMLCNKWDPAGAKTLNFFSKYIFPGGEFPSVGTFIVAAEEAGLKCVEEIAFGQDYVRTMDEAWNRFQRNKDEVMKKLGYDDEFIRKWEFYIAGWYAMFKSGQFNVMQAKLAHYP